MPVKRYDAGQPLRSPRRMPNGFLAVDGFATRAGVFHYRLADGKVLRELRPPEEVFAQASLDSLAMVPVTDQHPPEGLLDPTNAKAHTRGTTGEAPRREGDHVAVSLMLTDAALIDKVETGRAKQLSCGYLVEHLDMTPGVWNGQPYDAVQRGITYNHLAVVPVGRAGPTVAVKLDATDAVQEGDPMEKVKIDGVEFEVTTQVAQALARQNAARAALDSAAAASLEKEKARADASSAELEKERKARTDAENPERIRKAVAARVALEVVGVKVLGPETKLDTMDDAALKRAVIAKVDPSAKLEGKSEAYVDARFDLAVEQLTSRNDGLAALNRSVNAPGPVGAAAVSSTFEEAQRKFMASQKK